MMPVLQVSSKPLQSHGTAAAVRAVRAPGPPGGMLFTTPLPAEARPEVGSRGGVGGDGVNGLAMSSSAAGRLMAASVSPSGTGTGGGAATGDGGGGGGDDGESPLGALSTTAASWSLAQSGSVASLRGVQGARRKAEDEVAQRALALGCILLGFWLSKEPAQYFTRPPK